MNQLPERNFQSYGRFNHIYHSPRIAWGPDRAEYEPPARCERTSVGATQIEVGKTYRAYPKNGMYDVQGRSRSGFQSLIAAKNHRGELVLCHQADDGRPFGGYSLANFEAAVLQK